MVQIGTIEYEARVTGADEAKGKTDDLQQSQEQLAESSDESASSLNNFSGTVETAGSSTDRTTHRMGKMSNQSTLLNAKAKGLIGTIGTLIVSVTGLGGVAGTVAGALGTVKTVLSGLTLSGVVGTVVGAFKGFVGWLAAGSAGALAVAAAIGAAIGLFGAWILHVTGALDAIADFGSFVGNVLPGWVNDGILQIISLVAGPLAALGGFIIGTFEGGFDEGIARARETVEIFVGAWERQIDRIVGFAEDGWETLTQGWENLKDDVVGFIGDIEDAATDTVRAGFNAVVPDSVNIPSVTLSAPDWAGGMSATIGGGSIDLPQLNTGGMIERTGAAIVDRGEAVIPEPIVSAAEQAESGGSGGGGGGDVNVDVGEVVLKVTDPGFDPSDLSRREVEALADRLVRAMGKKTSNIAGTR
jgi:hypothetical protein